MRGDYPGIDVAALLQAFAWVVGALLVLCALVGVLACGGGWLLGWAFA